MKISFVIPFHNEEKNVKAAIDRISQFATDHKLNYEIIPVDDRSTDKTKNILAKLVLRDTHLKPIYRKKDTEEKGNTMGRALVEGTRSATGSVIIWSMGDLADDTRTYLDIINKINEGYDMVFGSRYMPGGSRGNLDVIKAFLSSWGTRVAKFLFNMSVNDITNAFRGFRKDMFNQIKLKSPGFSISPEFAIKAHLAGFKLDEVPTVYTNRVKGLSSFKLFKMTRSYLILYLSLFWQYKILKLLPAILIFMAVLGSFLIYKSSLGGYFFQDDWFTIRVSRASNLPEFLELFVPRKDVIYYRPLGMQIPFFILRSLFGSNALPFHLLVFITHTINILLVYFLINLIKKDKIVASISAFIYGISAVHYVPMFWPATYAFVLGPLTFFLSFILFILSLQKKRRLYYLLSLFVFLAGLLTNEMTAVLPAILFLYLLFFQKIKLRKLLPFFCASLFLFILRFLVFPPPVSGSYELGLGKETLLNLRAYILWSFNWPEEMKAQFLSLFEVNQQFITDFTSYFWSYILTFSISFALMFIIPGLLIIFRRKRKFFPVFLFGGSWFIIGLAPVVFFSRHAFSYYLPISLVGLLLAGLSLFKYLIEEVYPKYRFLAITLVFILLTAWTYSSVITTDFNSKIHWAPRRAKLSKQLIDEVKKQKQQGVVLVNYTSENKLALNDQDAMKIIYNNDDLITVYEGDPLYQK